MMQPQISDITQGKPIQLIYTISTITGNVIATLSGTATQNVNAYQAGIWTLSSTTAGTQDVNAYQKGPWNVGLNSGTNTIGTITAQQGGAWTVTSSTGTANVNVISSTAAQDVNAYQTGTWNVGLNDVYVALKQILNVLTRPTWLDPTTGRLNLNSLTTLTSLTTGALATVTTLNQLAGFSARDNAITPWERTNWQSNIRGRIT